MSERHKSTSGAKKDHAPVPSEPISAAAHPKGAPLPSDRVQDEHLSALLDHSPSLAFLKDEEGRYVYLNKAYEELFVHSADWHGKTDYDFWPQESAELFRANDADVLRSGEARQLVEDSLDLEGQRHVWVNYKFPYVDSQGRRYTGGIGIDATRLFEAEEALQESEQKYRGFFESMNEGFCIIEVIFDREGCPVDYRFLETNSAFEEQTGLHDTLGRTIRELVPANEPYWYEIYGRIAKTRVPERFEQVADALGRNYEVSAFPIGSPESNKVGIFFRDITERKKAEEALRESEQRATLLVEIADAVAMSTESKEVAERALDVIKERLGADIGSILLVESAAMTGQCVASFGYPNGSPEALEYKFDDNSVTGQAVTRGVVVVVDSETSPPPDTERNIKVLGKPDSRWVGIPVLVHDTVIACVDLGIPGMRRFTAAEIVLFEAIGHQLAPRFENARLLEIEHERARLNQSMIDMSEMLSSSLDLGKSLPRVLESMVTELGAMNASTIDRVEGGWRVRETIGSLGISPGDFYPDSEAPSAMAMLTSRRALIIEDVAGDDRVNSSWAKRLGYRGYAGLPLVVRGELVGLISFHFRERHPFSDPERDYLTRAAFAISLAEENARLYKTEHNIAETLQETLVVVPFQLPEVKFSRAYESATSEAGRVGGDFVDMFEVKGHMVGIVIGDVSGKGMDAAVITSLVRNTVRAHAIDGLSPEQVCEKTSNVMRRFTDVDAYVTMFFGVLDTRSGLLRYVGAGHPPGFVVSRDGATDELEVKSPIIGAFDDVQFHESRTYLRAGERLVLYTDGVVEARDSTTGAFFDLDGIRRSIESRRAQDTASLADSLLGDVREFSEGVLRDDAAVLVVEPTRLRSHDNGHPTFEFDSEVT